MQKQEILIKYHVEKYKITKALYIRMQIIDTPKILEKLAIH